MNSFRPLRVVYAGTPEFAVPALDGLLTTPHSVVAVYTQPDRPAGRGRVLTAGPVKQRALQHGLPVEQPTTFRDDAAVALLRQYAPDVLVVAAYGLILPEAVLRLPTHGCVNIHASLLPRWRGAAPIQRAILAGDSQTGITLMRMEAGLDTGPMLRRASLNIAQDESAAQLHDRLAKLGTDVLLDALKQPAQSWLQGEPQPQEGITYAKKINKAEALIDWTLPALLLHRQVRAFDPWPVAETRLSGVQLRIWQACVIDVATPPMASPGAILRCDTGGIWVACGTGVIGLERLQLPGRSCVSAAEFVRSHDLRGCTLG